MKILLFGANGQVGRALQRGPLSGHEVIALGLPCQPCTLHGRERCPKGHFRCMTGITVDGVLERVERLLHS